MRVLCAHSCRAGWGRGGIECRRGGEPGGVVLVEVVQPPGKDVLATRKRAPNRCRSTPHPVASTFILARFSSPIGADQPLASAKAPAKVPGGSSRVRLALSTSSFSRANVHSDRPFSSSSRHLQAQQGRVGQGRYRTETRWRSVGLEHTARAHASVRVHTRHVRACVRACDT